MPDAATKRIVEGKLAPEIARFGTPIALGMALQTTFNLVDAYLVAQLPHGEVGASIGALGLCDQLAAIGTIASYGISTASGTFLSHQKGANDDAAIQRTAWQSLLLVLALSALFGVAGVAFAGPIVRTVIGVKGDVATVAVKYVRVIIGGSFSIFFQLQLTSMLRSLGSAKTPVAFLVAGNVLNIFLSILFMFGSDSHAPWLAAWSVPIARAIGIPRMGMVGAAWGTILARSLTLVPLAIVLMRRFKVEIPKKGERGFDREELGKIWALTWPSSATFVVRIAAMLFVNSLVARAFTTESDQTATTAMGLVFRLDTIALFVAMGWGSAAQTFVGQNMGAKKAPRAFRSGWITSAYDAVSSVGLWVLFHFAGEAILHIFDRDPGPVGIALAYLRIVAPSYVALGIGVVLGNAMTGAGAAKTAFKADALVIVLFQLPISIAAALIFGHVEWVFRGVAATNVVSAIVYAIVYARGRWRTSIQPLTASESR